MARTSKRKRGKNAQKRNDTPNRTHGNAVNGPGFTQSVTTGPKTSNRTHDNAVNGQTSGTVTMTWPVFGLVLALALVVGLIAGSFAAREEVIVHQSAPVPQTQAQQTPAPDEASAQSNISRETLERISALERKVVTDPKNRQAFVELGHVYFDTHQHQNAIQAYENALALDDRDADVLTDLGVMYRAVKAFDKAVACFDKAQRIQPGHRISLYNKGIVLYFDLHRHEEGIKTWEELLALDPNQKTPNGFPLSEFIRQARESANKGS